MVSSQKYGIEKSVKPCYNKIMEQGLKRIELFGGKHAFLEFVSDDTTSYIVRAYDCDSEERNVVAVCYFDIERLFQRHLSENEILKNAQYFGGIEKTPKTSELFLKKKDLPNYNIKNNILIFKTHGIDKLFPLKFAKCYLESIEIKNEEYFKVGLGSAMLKVVEAFAIANDRYMMYAHYAPYGKFQTGTKNFYMKNGFIKEFDACDGKMYANKFLSKQPIIHKNTIVEKN